MSGVGARAGSGAGMAEKATLPQAGKRGGAGKRVGGPGVSGPRQPRNELYTGISIP